MSTTTKQFDLQAIRGGRGDADSSTDHARGHAHDVLAKDDIGLRETLERPSSIIACEPSAVSSAG